MRALDMFSGVGHHDRSSQKIHFHHNPFPFHKYNKYSHTITIKPSNHTKLIKETEANPDQQLLYIFVLGITVLIACSIDPDPGLVLTTRDWTKNRK